MAASSELLRVYVVPLTQRRWAFCYKEMFENKPDAPVAHWKTGTGVSSKGVLFAKGLASRARHEARELENSDPSMILFVSNSHLTQDSLKGKLYNIGRRTLLDKQDPLETFLASIPRDSTSFEVFYAYLPLLTVSAGGTRLS
jgi:hypothetical protein